MIALCSPIVRVRVCSMFVQSARSNFMITLGDFDVSYTYIFDHKFRCCSNKSFFFFLFPLLITLIFIIYSLIYLLIQSIMVVLIERAYWQFCLLCAIIMNSWRRTLNPQFFKNSPRTNRALLHYSFRFLTIEDPFFKR